MVLQGIIHKLSETEWTLETTNGDIFPLLPSDIITYYNEMHTCGKPICGCWILKEGLTVEYQVIEQDGVQYANII